MNILLINHYAGSDRMGMEFRPFHFAREWVAAGHRVTILAASFSHLRGSQPPPREDLGVTEEEGVRFRWLRTNRYTSNGAWRAANMLGFSGKLLIYAGRIARTERPDVVICSSTYPLDIYAGARIARRLGARLVFEVHDLWPLTPMLLGGYSAGHPYIRALQHAEDWAYRHADVVVSILPDARDHMVARGLDPRKFVHIPNGVPVVRAGVLGGSVLPAGIDTLIDHERRRGRFLIGYVGGINLNMALDLVVDAAPRLTTAGVSFLIAGDGSNAGRLRERLARAKLDNVHMLGRIAKAAVPAFLARMDALVIPWHRNPLYRYGVSPNKVFDYMLAGRPILQASEASNDLVGQAECGFTVEPEDPAALATAACRLRGLSEDERRRLGENGRNFVIRNHDSKELSFRFLDAMRGGAALR